MEPGPAVRLFDVLLEIELNPPYLGACLTTEEACTRAGIFPPKGARILHQMLERGDVIIIRYGFNGGRVWRLGSDGGP